MLRAVGSTDATLGGGKVRKSGRGAGNGKGSGAVVPLDLIRLLGEGANGAQVFTDGGTAGSIWTPSGAPVVTSTAQFAQGAASILVPGSSDYLGTPYNTNNAITSGDFYIGFYLRTTSPVGSTYIMGVDTVDGSPSNRGWLVYFDITNRVLFYWSDGTTTRSLLLDQGTSSNIWYYFRIERVGSTIYLSRDLGAPASVAASGQTINIPPTSPALRLGAALGAASGTTAYFDMVQIKRGSVFGGAALTSLPTSPV